MRPEKKSRKADFIVRIARIWKMLYNRIEICPLERDVDKENL